MQRSQKYDWFKGNQNKDKKKDVKQGLKTTWKFTKIFLIFVVLFISLWGCVQGFTLKQSSFVGKGTEFYLSESEIPPHITEFQEKTESTTAATDIYSVVKTDTNVWLNRQDDKNNGSTMKAVHDEFKAQGVESMADAYKGVNEAVRLVNNHGTSATAKPIITDTNGVPVVLSTETTIKPTYASDFTNPLAKIGTIRIYDGFDATKPAGSRITYKDIDTSDQNNLYNFPKSTLGTHSADVKSQAIEGFRNEVINALGTHGSSNWIIDALKGQLNGAAIPSVADATEEKALYNKLQIQQDRAIAVMKYLGYTIDGEDHKNQVALSNWNWVPGSGGETYVPILTWGQAWTRGVGPFYGLVVFPISKFTTLVADAFPFMEGWETLLAMVIVIFALRFLGFLISFRSTLQQTKMQELNLKKAAIDAKYAPYKGNKQMQARQRQEISEMYKKEGVSPMGAFTNTLIVMPLFLAIWRVIGSTPHIKSTVWYGINFSATSWRELFHGDMIYLPLMFLAVSFSIGSQLFPKLLTRKRDKLRGNAHLKQAMKKGNKTQIIVMIITAGMSLIFSAGLQVYWIVVSIWSVLQAYITHEILKYKHKKDRRKTAA